MGSEQSQDEKPSSLLNAANVAKPTLEVSLTDEKSETYDPPPDGGLDAWLVVFSCFLLFFNILGLPYAYGVYEAHYLLHQFPNGSAELISLTGSICTFMTLLVGMPVGRWVEIFGFRKVALGGSILFSGALVAAGFCRTVPTLLLTQGIFTGIGAGALFVPATAAPAQWFVKRRSLSIGLSAAGAGVGGISWSFVIRIIIARLGYQWALWSSACISACINAIALCFLKTRPLENSKSSSIWSGLAMFKDPKFVTLYCASGLGVFGYTVPFFYVPTYAQTQMQSSPSVGSILSAIIDLGVTFGRITLGLLADSKLGTMNTVISGMALAGLCQITLWLPAANSLPLLYIFSFMHGFFGGGYMGVLPAVLAQIFDPQKLPAVTGLFFTSELPGQIAGGPIAAVILKRMHGQWAPVILYSGFTVFCGSLLAAITRFQVDRRVLVTV